MSISDKLLSRLSDPSLLPAAGLVGGTWITEADTGRRFDVDNPSNGEVIASLPDMGAQNTRQAIDAAHEAQKSWAAMTAKERGAIMRRLYELQLENADDLATILTMEMGKPFAEARGEIVYGASFMEWFAEEAKRVYGDTIPGHQGDKRLVVIKQPIGVVGAITPWNFPNAMITRKVAPALATGCTVVVKPAEQTPLSAIALGVLAERAGMPAGVFNLIVGEDGPAIGRELSDNDKVRKLTFTGSTEVGRILMRQCSDQIKKIGLELGGNAPFIVFDDADIDAAVDGAMISKYRNAGQTCVCANRIYVQAGVYDEFAEKLAVKVRELKVGDGFEERRDHRSAHRQAGPIEGRGTRLGCAGPRRHGADGRQTRRARRHILRADSSDRRLHRDEGGARGNLRARGAAVPLRDRRGGDRACQCDGIRPRVLFLRPRPVAGLDGRRGAGIRHGRHQYRPDFD